MDGSPLILEVMISTCGPDGGRKIEAMNLPRLSGVTYLVSWQVCADKIVPENLARRDDVRFLFLEGRGLSRNRNNCLDHARGDILLVADDDLKFYPEGLQEIRRIFTQNPSLEYASFRYDSDYPKEYPAHACSLAHLPKNFYQASIEIALRRESRAGKLRFCESFGLGAEKYTAGEEELFLKKARLNGLDCRFFPVTIALHPARTTGVASRLSDGTIRAFGACAAVEYPFSAILRIPLVSYRNSRQGKASFLRHLRLMFAGTLAALPGNIASRYLKQPL